MYKNVFYYYIISSVVFWQAVFTLTIVGSTLHFTEPSRLHMNTSILHHGTHAPFLPRIRAHELFVI